MYVTNININNCKINIFTKFNDLLRFFIFLIPFSEMKEVQNIQGMCWLLQNLKEVMFLVKIIFFFHSDKLLWNDKL